MRQTINCHKSYPPIATSYSLWRDGDFTELLISRFSSNWWLGEHNWIYSYYLRENTLIFFRSKMYFKILTINALGFDFQINNKCLSIITTDCINKVLFEKSLWSNWTSFAIKFSWKVMFDSLHCCASKEKMILATLLCDSEFVENIRIRRESQQKTAKFIYLTTIWCCYRNF